MRKVLSFWVTPFRADTWRRFGYAIVAPVLCAVSLVRALAAGRWRVAARVAAALAIGLVTWVLLQDLAFLMLINIGYPARVYISAGHHANFLPWDGWNLLWTIRFHRATGPSPWANNYTTAWGGPTLAGAWAVHAGLTLLTVYPVFSWAIRGLVRVQRWLTTEPPAAIAEPVPVVAHSSLPR